MEKKVEYIPIQIVFNDRATYVFIMLALILPGFGIIYLSNKELFESLATIKLIILSLFYSLPLFLIFYLPLSVPDGLSFSKDKKDKSLEVLYSTAFSSLSNSFILTGAYLFFQSKLFDMPFLNISLFSWIYFVSCCSVCFDLISFHLQGCTKIVSCIFFFLFSIGFFCFLFLKQSFF